MAIIEKNGQVEYFQKVIAIEDHYLGDGESPYIAVVWNDSQNEPDRVIYGSTYGCDKAVVIDATDDIKNKYELYNQGLAIIQNMAARYDKSLLLSNRRKRIKKAAYEHKFSIFEFYKLMKQYTDYQIDHILKLMETNIRSGFKKSILDQILDWLKTPTVRKYKTPLSEKQLAALINTHTTPYKPFKRQY